MDLVYLQSELVRVGHGDGLSLFAVCIGTGRSFAVCIGTGRSFAVCIGCIGLGRSWRLDLVYLKSSLVRVGHLQFALVAFVSGWLPRVCDNTEIRSVVRRHVASLNWLLQVDCFTLYRPGLLCRFEAHRRCVVR